MRVFLYSRVSVGKVDETYSQDPSMQLTPMRQYCEMMKWEVAGEFTDIDMGDDLSRPQFFNMIKRLEAKEADTIMVWKLDRLTRLEARETLNLIHELKQRGVAVKSLQESWLDTTSNNPTASVILYIVAWLAEQEKANVSMRVKAGIANKRAKGEWHGGRPKGKKDTKPRERRFARNPDMTVSELFHAVK
jgi:DNA invertase Pin-like site-specific DNA recombinase